MTTDLALAPASLIQQFQLDSDLARTAQRWKRWMQRVENLYVAVNLTNVVRQ